MTYRELLELYKQGKLEEEKRKKVEADIERQDAISEYLYEMGEIPQLDDLEPDIAQGKIEQEDNTAEQRFVHMMNRSIRKAFVKMGITVGAVVLAIILVVIFVLPNLVSVFYYNPAKMVVEQASEDSRETNQMSLDMAVYTEMMVPESQRDEVLVDHRGYGKYDICIMQNVSWDGEFTNVSGKIERGELTLYDTNTLRKMPGNEFDWTQRENPDASLTELDALEKIEEEKLAKEDGAEKVNILHGAIDRETAEQKLQELQDGEIYFAYVTLDKMMDYESFCKYFMEEHDIYPRWCAVRTNGDENFMFTTDNIGFYCTRNGGNMMDWDEEKYPELRVESDQKGEYEKKSELLKTEEYAKQHFLSMLHYMQDQKDFCKMMEDMPDFESAINYVENNGLTIYGFTIIGNKDEMQKINKLDNVYVMDIKDVR